MTDKKIDIKLQEAELKIIIESEYKLSEKNKIDYELKKLKKEHRSLSYKLRYIIKPLIAGIISVPIIWFYWKEVSLPLMKSKEMKFELAQAEYEKKFRNFILEKKKLLKDYEDLKVALRISNYKNIYSKKYVNRIKKLKKEIEIMESNISTNDKNSKNSNNKNIALNIKVSKIKSNCIFR